MEQLKIELESLLEKTINNNLYMLLIEDKSLFYDILYPRNQILWWAPNPQFELKPLYTVELISGKPVRVIKYMDNEKYQIAENFESLFNEPK